jgi:RNA polymerase sigma-70 factor (ECF subfamily)
MTRARDDDLRGRAGRFKVLALPHLDDAYALARYLLGSATDAEDAVQDCYLRALQHFDTYHGPEFKPWLFAILRNSCHALRAKRRTDPPPGASGVVDDEALECAEPLWNEAQETPERAVLRRLDAEAVRGLVAALPDQFREVIVLREINDLSYREIAEVIGTPVGTVMSRLARARALLRTAWLAAEDREEPR